MNEDQQKKSYKTTFLVVGAVSVFVLTAGTVFTLLLMSSTAEETEEQATVSSQVKNEVIVPTKDEVKQNLATLDASIKQANADQTAAKAAIKDSTKQTKIGS